VSAVLAVLLAACAGPAQAPTQGAAAEALPDDPLRAHELAVEAYRAGDPGSAHVLWSAALEAGGDSLDRAGLLYDLGNAAYRLGRPLEAVGWYTAAIRRRPRFADAWANLELVRGEVVLEPADRGELSATLDRLAHGLTLRESEMLVLVLAGLWGAALGYEALRGGAQGRRLALGGTLLVALGCVPWVARLSAERGDPLMVVAPEGARVHSAPQADAAVIALLPAGTRVERDDELVDWVRVARRPDPGWVRAKEVFALRR